METCAKMCKHIALIVSCLMVFSTDASPPPFITKCKGNDSKCILESAKVALPIFAKGLSQYNVPSLDPLNVKSIDASEGNLIFKLSDVVITGLKNCEVKKLERDVAKSKLHMQFLCSGKLDGQYELNGSILVLQIEGKGDIHADLNECVVNIEADIIEKEREDGKKHWQMKTWSHSFDLIGKSNVEFGNLFEGNEVLGRAARQLISENGNDIIKEIGPNVIKSLVAKVLKAINSFFKALAVEDLSLD